MQPLCAFCKRPGGGGAASTGATISRCKAGSPTGGEAEESCREGRTSASQNREEEKRMGQTVSPVRVTGSLLISRPAAVT